MNQSHSSDENPHIDEVEVISATSEPNQPEETQRNPIFKRISTANPFYLLSAAFVIHSTGLSIGEGLSLPILLSLIGGYLVLLATIGMAIVHFWKVWDDARSIFLTLVLLMLELSLCFDQSIALKQTEAILGLLGITAGALFVSEFIIRALRIRLPLMYRLPFFLQLSLAMLAALIPMSVGNMENGSLARWAIYGVSALAGLSMLTLIPAIRTSRDRVEFKGCPWIWPFHPWSLFVIVWVCLGFRLYLLTISFDPALELSGIDAYDRMGSIFGGYLLVPMLLGLAWLLVEGALVHRHWFVHAAALALPMICIVLSIYPEHPNLALAGFYREYTQTLGSPVWLATLVCLFFYSMSWWRGLPFSRRCLVVSMLLLSRVTPTTYAWQTIGDVNLAWISAAAVVLSFVGLQRKNSRFLIEAAAWLSLGVGTTSIFAGWELSVLEIQIHLFVLAVVLLSFWFRDETMTEFKVLLVWFFFIASARMVLHSFYGIRPPLFSTSYLLVMAVIAGLLNYVHPKQGFLAAIAFISACAYGSAFTEGGRYLNHQVRWHGLRQFLIGLGLLHIGVITSAWKGGVFKKWLEWADIPGEKSGETMGNGEKNP